MLITWHSRPVFISSTFKDMHAERDWLQRRVFPSIEEELRKRDHHLEPIDLRLGVETAEAPTEEARLKYAWTKSSAAVPFCWCCWATFTAGCRPRSAWRPPSGSKALRSICPAKALLPLRSSAAFSKRTPRKSRAACYSSASPCPAMKSMI